MNPLLTRPVSSRLEPTREVKHSSNARYPSAGVKAKQTELMQ
jgi:hypothetical protein